MTRACSSSGIAFWGDLVEFEIMPVVPSSERRETIEPLL
jgi:hypothetical protein